MSLEHIPEDKIMPEMCFVAIYYWGAALELEAVKNCGWMLRLVPENLKTQELCLAAVKENGFVIDYVPEKLREVVRCRLAGA